MALFNYASRELTLKVVYYGPGLSGKTTNLQQLHAAMPEEKTGKLLSLSTETDRTLFFDFLPVSAGKIRDFNVKFQLYTVPGQVRYNSTRKLVLKGADAVVFVADSQAEMKDYNIESLKNMKENLAANNIDPDEIPIVLQYNKRDLPNVLSVEELDGDLNASRRYQTVSSEAVNGKGVSETFRVIARLLLEQIKKKHKIDIEPPDLENIAAPRQKKDGKEAAVVAIKEIPPPRIEIISEKPFQPEAGISIKISEGAATLQAPPLEVPFFESSGYLDGVTSDINRALSDVSIQMKTSNEVVVGALTTIADSIKAIVGEMKEMKRQQKELIEKLNKRP